MSSAQDDAGALLIFIVFLPIFGVIVGPAALFLLLATPLFFLDGKIAKEQQSDPRWNGRVLRNDLPEPAQSEPDEDA